MAATEKMVESVLQFSSLPKTFPPHSTAYCLSSLLSCIDGINMAAVLNTFEVGVPYF
jgi:hypothetical protein